MFLQNIELSPQMSNVAQVVDLWAQLANVQVLAFIISWVS